MKTELNLMLHCCAHAVERKEILNLDTPQGNRNTRADSPLTELTSTLAHHNHRIVNEAHALTADGNRYFGMLQLESDAIDHAIIVGVRNSHDKTFPAAIAAGSGPAGREVSRSQARFKGQEAA